MQESPTEREPWHDPIVEEVRHVRETLFAAAGYDIREFCRRLRQKQASSGHLVVRRAPGTPSGTPGEAA